MSIKYCSTIDLAFLSLLAFALVLLIYTSWQAPMSGDEYVHVVQAEKNIDYLTSFGSNKEALNTPISRLKHYGQSFDTLTTLLARIFDVRDVYRLRHVSNAFVAWLTILFASLIAVRITKDLRTGLITVVLFLVSMRFLGHAMNNLKDIPFSFAFIFTIYFIFRYLEHISRISCVNVVFIVVGIAFAISIRIGGLLLFAYHILFLALYLYYLENAGDQIRGRVLKISSINTALSLSILAIAYAVAIVPWPWALENPLINPMKSLELMHNYPTTVRQVFEGKLYWSDMFPYYYLFKYLLVTLPVIVLLGLLLFFMIVGKWKMQKGIVFSVFLVIAFGFPLFYASVTGANVYGGWRQLLFVYPPLVVVSSVGIWLLLKKIWNQPVLRYLAVCFMLFLLLNPIRFFILNYPYQYIYFNELVGGSSGAFGRYELDYYFTSFKKAYEWIDDQAVPAGSIVAANFIIPEYYKNKSYSPKLIDYYQRSDVDWDYAIVCNTFLDPFQLKNGYWPPSNTIFTEKVDGVPILAVLKRPTKSDLSGKRLLDLGKPDEALGLLTQANALDPRNESILINLARTYIRLDRLDEADRMLADLEEIYPQNEWGVDLRGEIAVIKGDIQQAIDLYETNLSYNHKFYHSYINLAKAYLLEGNEQKAISSLKACLRINPYYEPGYQLYGKLLLAKGDTTLGKKMLEFSVQKHSKYERK